MLSKQVVIHPLNNQKEVFEDLLSYWKQQLAGVPPLLELPTDHLRPSEPSYQGASLSFSLSTIFSASLNQLSKQSDTTLFMTLLAAFNTLLHRYTNQEDIAIGHPIAECSIGETGKLKDSLQNILVMRTDLSGNPGFRELLVRIRKLVLDAYAHKDLSLERLVEVLSSERGSNHLSLFQVMFSYQDFNVNETDANRLIKSFRTKENQTPLIDLSLSIEDTPQGLIGVWEYNMNLFDANTIARMAEHFKILLEGIIANPEQRISQLPILSKAERHQLLFEWNNTYTKYPDDKCIHELFEEQVIKTPNFVAVMFEKQQLTYNELNERSNQLAHYLRNNGVKEETLVPICIVRSVEMIIGILGVLKAGGAYVPIDPNYPRTRIQHMLKDTNSSIVLSTTECIELLNDQVNTAKIVDLKYEWSIIAEQPTVNLENNAVPSNLAYVIYTSGSTGKPKGVMIEHGGVVNLITAQSDFFHISSDEKIVQFSNYCFDASVEQIFLALFNGASLVLFREGLQLNIDLFEDFLKEKKITHLHATPFFLENLHAGSYQYLKRVIAGGDVCKRELSKCWENKVNFYNEYGPTETTVTATEYHHHADNIEKYNSLPIGKPVANLQIYILDKHQLLCPIGVVGEIYIGGAGVARGYLNRPELTEERFILNPFSDDPYARLYKTGDLARFLSNGNIVFLGRIDHQVKIRGYRIELGEIEAALGQHPAIQQMVVIAREDSPGNKRLLAYLVPNQEHTPSTSDLRVFLSHMLPAYMVPSVFIFMKSLPLNANGKVDRAALPVPDQQRAESERNVVAPRDSIELALVKIFEECLHTHPVGVQDDFFELGGNSIGAALMFSQIRKTFRKQLPLAILLLAPTIEKLSDYLREKEKVAPWSSLVPIQPKGAKLPLFCVHGGWGNVLFYKYLSQHLGIDQPLYGLQAKGLNENDDPYYNLEEMAAHYIREIRTVQPNGPYHIAGYCFGAIIAFEMAQQLHLQGDKVAFLGSFNGISPTSIQKIKVDHLNTLKALGTTEKLLYPLRVLRHNLKGNILLGRLQVGQFKVQLAIRALWYKFYFIQGRALPEALRRYYIIDAMQVALETYSPRPYPGQLTIFRSPKIYRHPHLGWSSLVEGHLKTHDIPGNHSNRNKIMYEPFVQFLAQELKNCLSQTNLNGRSDWQDQYAEEDVK
ncbi:MAG: amino acid adenylation domain-containing protein [Chitinophagaceae bacterium]